MAIGNGGQGIGDGVEAAESIEDTVQQVYDELYGKLKEEQGEELEIEERPERDSDSPETVEETLERSIDELKDKEEPEAEEKPAKKAKQKVTEAPQEEEIAPPNDWTAQAKEWFKTQPREYQAETKRVADQFQSWRQKELGRIKSEAENLANLHSEVSGAVEVVRRFLPVWGVTGKTPEAALTELCTFNDLVIKDPETALKNLAKAVGRDITINNPQNRQEAPKQDFNYSDVYNRVKTDLSNEQAQYENLRRAQAVEQETNAALAELQNEVNDQGRYIYPDLHDVGFQRQLEPLAISIYRANPNLAWKDVLLRAYKGSDGRVLPRTIPTAKLNGNASNKASFAKRAASSSSGSYGAGMVEDLDFIPNESVEDTVARAFKLHNNR